MADALLWLCLAKSYLATNTCPSTKAQPSPICSPPFGTERSTKYGEPHLLVQWHGWLSLSSMATPCQQRTERAVLMEPALPLPTRSPPVSEVMPSESRGPQAAHLSSRHGDASPLIFLSSSSLTVHQFISSSVFQSQPLPACEWVFQSASISVFQSATPSVRQCVPLTPMDINVVLTLWLSSYPLPHQFSHSNPSASCSVSQFIPFPFLSCFHHPVWLVSSLILVSLPLPLFLSLPISLPLSSLKTWHERCLVQISFISLALFRSCSCFPSHPACC